MSLLFGLWSLVFGLWSLDFGLRSLFYGLCFMVLVLGSLVFGAVLDSLVLVCSLSLLFVVALCRCFLCLPLVFGLWSLDFGLRSWFYGLGSLFLVLVCSLSLLYVVAFCVCLWSLVFGVVLLGSWVFGLVLGLGLGLRSCFLVLGLGLILSCAGAPRHAQIKLSTCDRESAAQEHRQFAPF